MKQITYKDNILNKATYRNSFTVQVRNGLTVNLTEMFCKLKSISTYIHQSLSAGPISHGRYTAKIYYAK